MTGTIDDDGMDLQIMQQSIPNKYKHHMHCIKKWDGIRESLRIHPIFSNIWDMFDEDFEIHPKFRHFLRDNRP